ncbi:MAG: hypothetical protein H0X62_08345 [Bacteroidetes bacterium]|nr:hypothetical protein [Bacteroidota bacterium]
MKTKRKYLKPKIEKVILDKEISMVMMSNPLVGGDDISLNPFKWIK